MKTRIIVGVGLLATLLVVPVISLFALLGFASSFAQCQTSETIKTIEKAWHSKEERLQSARIAWSEKHTVTKGLVTDFARRLPSGDRALKQMGIPPGSTVPPEDVTFDTSATFSVDGAKARLDYDDQQWSAGKKEYVSQPEVRIYDGQLSKRLLPKGTPYTPWPTGHVTRGNPFPSLLTVIPVVLALRPAHAIDLDKLELMGQRTVIQGTPCIELQRRSGNYVERIWIDPSRDFIVLRLEKNSTRVDVHYQRNINSEWLPDSWETVCYRRNGGLERSLRATVKSALLNPQTNAAEYDLTFPPGTLVADDTTVGPEANYIVKEGGRKHIVRGEEAGLPPQEVLRREPR